MSDLPKEKDGKVIPPVYPDKPPEADKPTDIPLPMTATIDPITYPDPPSIVEHNWQPRMPDVPPLIPIPPRPRRITGADTA